MTERDSTAEIRFASKWRPNGDCWEWTGTLNRLNGYGRFTVGGRKVVAHRWAYEHWVAPVPSGLDLDHLCRNRWCVNPDHLEPVTRRENLLRSPLTLNAANAAKTMCPRGHTYTATPAQRVCRTCEADRRRLRSSSGA